MEDHQADVLGGGNVAGVLAGHRWTRLAHRDSDAAAAAARLQQPLVRVSRLDLGQGVVATPARSPPGDLRPNYLGRVQPYAVYVPRHVSLHKRRR